VNVSPDKLAKFRRRNRIAYWATVAFLIGMGAWAIFGGPFRPIPYFPPLR
jgi:hypothetical protein